MYFQAVETKPLSAQGQADSPHAPARKVVSPQSRVHLAIARVGAGFDRDALDHNVQLVVSELCVPQAISRL